MRHTSPAADEYYSQYDSPSPPAEPDYPPAAEAEVDYYSQHQQYDSQEYVSRAEAEVRNGRAAHDNEERAGYNEKRVDRLYTTTESNYFS